MAHPLCTLVRPSPLRKKEVYARNPCVVVVVGVKSAGGGDFAARRRPPPSEQLSVASPSTEGCVPSFSIFDELAAGHGGLLVHEWAAL